MDSFAPKEKTRTSFVSGMIDGEEREAFRKPEEMYRSLVESSGFGVATTDFRGKFTFVNETLCKMIGYSKNELLGKHFGNFLHSEDKSRILKVFLNAWKYPTRRPSFEFRVVHKKGHVIHMYSTPTLYRRKGKILGFAAIIADITERKRMEESLRKSEDRYRSIVELAPDGVVTVDMNGAITSVNTAFSRISGYSKDEVVGRHFAELGALQADNAPEYLRLFNQTKVGDPLPPTEFAYLCKDGTEHWGEAHIGFVESGGKRVGLQGVLRDITERKKTEQAILENQQKFERLFRGIPEAAIYWDPMFHVLDVNSRFTELFGYSLDEIKGKHSTSFIVPEDRVRESNAWGEKARKGYVDHDTVRKRKDGSLVPVSMSVAPIVVDGQPAGYFDLYKDITTRKKVEKALKESEERFRAIVENAPFGYYRVGKNGLWQYVNPVWERMHGFSLEEVIGKPFEITQTEDSVELARDTVKRALTGETIVGEFSRLTREDGIKYHSFNIQPVKHRDEIVAIEGFINDITDRKKAEEALRKSEEKYKGLFENARDVILTADLEGNVTSINKAIEEYGWKKEEIIGKNMLELMLKESWPSLLKGIDQIAEGKPLEGEMELATPIGKRIAEYRSNPIIQDGDVIGVQVIGRDITERKLVETRLSALNFFGGRLNVSESLEEIYELILDAMEKTLGFEYAEFNVIDGGKFRVACQRGFKKTVCDLPLDGNKGGIIVKAVRNRKPVLVHDVKKDPDYVEGPRHARSELAVPVIADNEVLGVLNVESKRLNAFGEEDAALLGILASHAATAISNLRKRNQVEMALRKIRESEEKYRNLFENARDVIVTVDCRGSMTSANNIVSEYGYEPDELVGKSLFSLFPEEYWKEFQDYFQKLAEGKPIEGEFRVESKQMQGYKVIEYKSSPTIQDGKVVGAQVIARDVTERREMEEKLRESEEKLRAITTSANDAILLIDDKGEFSYWNPAAEKMFGYTEEEIRNRKMYELITPERYREDHSRGFGKFEETGEGRLIGKTVCMAAIRRDGTEFPVEFSLSALQVKGKRYALGIVRDITERSKMEAEIRQYSEHLEELVRKRTEELMELEKKYSVLVEEASDGVAIVQDEKIVFTNKRGAEIFGYPKDELVGFDFEKLAGEKYRRQAKERYIRILRGEIIPAPFEAEAIGKDGENVPVEISSSLIHYQSRPADLIIIRDIRERKRLEHQRLKLEKLATIGELATMVAHDLRNPLTAIRNASFYVKSTCLHRGNTCKTILEMLDVIEQETLFADNIVSDLLDYAAKRPLRRKRRSINKIIVGLLTEGNVPENIEIQRNFAKRAIVVLDEKQLERVFLNLIRNAVQAMPSGGKLKVTTAETKELIEIKFADTGIGIPEESMSKIFTPLFTTKAKGIGMGLAICKRIIEEHGGTIDVKSKVGEGTTFTITLPKNKEASTL